MRSCGASLIGGQKLLGLAPAGPDRDDGSRGSSRSVP